MAENQKRTPIDDTIIAGASTLGEISGYSSEKVADGASLAKAPHRVRERSRRRKAPKTWKKILWIKQSYPDNYTDPSTFLSHLQWNPRVEPYNFWPLVADSTVIVQHISSVIIFVCCFVGIYQERVPPTSVVGWSSVYTFICWLIWDAWVSHEEHAKQIAKKPQLHLPTNGPPEPSLNLIGGNEKTQDSNMLGGNSSLDDLHGYLAQESSQNEFSLHRSFRWQQRVATVKSALLIYCAVLGLSPILKSFTLSTTSDSIWALSFWLILVNVFFYDYGGESNDQAEVNPAGVRYQSSLSTNAALMASTVLASRLKTTTHVFSLTLFSIEIFGLFPVFRRQLRQRSPVLHLSLTALLIIAAGIGLGLIFDNSSAEQLAVPTTTSWRSALIGAVSWSLINIAAMAGCSWWLIGLQKYKNVVIGPWDAAKPIVRGRGLETGR